MRAPERGYEKNEGTIGLRRGEVREEQRRGGRRRRKAGETIRHCSKARPAQHLQNWLVREKLQRRRSDMKKKTENGRRNKKAQSLTEREREGGGCSTLTLLRAE